MESKKFETIAGAYAKARNYFDADETFSGSSHLSALMDAYNEASRLSMLMARFALRDPKDREGALWAEASAATLERVLQLFATNLPSDVLDPSAWQMNEE